MSASWSYRTVWLEGDVLMYCVAKMGYKQELRRQYSTVQIFAVAFSIMGLVPSIASTLAFSLPAGPAGMVWVGAPDILVYFYLRSVVLTVARAGSPRVSSSSSSVWPW